MSVCGALEALAACLAAAVGLRRGKYVFLFTHVTDVMVGKRLQVLGEKRGKVSDDQNSGSASPVRRSFRHRPGNHRGRGGGHECCPSRTRRCLHKEDGTNGKTLIRRVR